mmetsp:Transcript_39591/g.66041  ORF Transcript_39591/g.66041 Transcript_39591/m.66041 type:complete len:630 (-) Transcript_39591:371-2260(-)|eukprot:CAMPEP_0184666894 /NCGR_PEP_ID=MMETSP0308-20130426/64458_1 /TAXON_ID=38269 /ORGANISM="Gloeochaete witrockiana, Strain SAG 46.84" /LENGTH=629 /DNA_ID=CAMNT_0027111775 /DNA_START=1 /DNA_END=1890 /DNA_ORIENTATION=-
MESVASETIRPTSFPIRSNSPVFKILPPPQEYSRTPFAPRGPGSYDPIPIPKNVPTPILHRGSDRFLKFEPSPGPPDHPDWILGPGVHDVPSLNHPSAFTFATYSEEGRRAKKVSPGPCSYNPRSLAESRSRSALIRITNPRATTTSTDESLGPGAYYPDESRVRPVTPTFRFSYAPRFEAWGNTPFGQRDVSNTRVPITERKYARTQSERSLGGETRASLRPRSADSILVKSSRRSNDQSRHIMGQEERRERISDMAEERDEKLKDAKERRQDLLAEYLRRKEFLATQRAIRGAKIATENRQRRWMVMIALATRLRSWERIVKEMRGYRVLLSVQEAGLKRARKYALRWTQTIYKRKVEHAVRVIHRFVRFCRIQLRILKKKRASYTVISFLRQFEESSSTLRVIKNFRFSVVRIERFIRGFIKCARAQSELLSKQWERTEQGMLGSGVPAPSALLADDRKKGASGTTIKKKKKKDTIDIIDKSNKKSKGGKKDKLLLAATVFAPAEDQVPEEIRKKMIFENLLSRRKEHVTRLADYDQRKDSYVQDFLRAQAMEQMRAYVHDAAKPAELESKDFEVVAKKKFDLRLLPLDKRPPCFWARLPDDNMEKLVERARNQSHRSDRTFTETF